MRGHLPVAALILAATLAWSPAEASLQLCNRTSYVIYAATAAQTGSDFSTKGWTRIAPGACATAIDGDLAAQAYLITAKSSRAHAGPPRAWSGNANLCVKDRDFSLKLPFGARCPQDGYELSFAPLDTHHMRSWTATFRESPDLASMAAAERAGLKRLLADSGVKTLANDKQIDDALAQTRKRLRLQPSAPAAAIFSALETEAMKSAVPTGYMLCNDTDKEVWAALAEQSGGAFHTRGWWTVGGGTCAPLITDSIAGSKIYLRVEHGKSVPLVEGPEKFCVTNIEFDIQGRGNCAKRGLTEAGFAETNSSRQAGFTARVTTGGLARK